MSSISYTGETGLIILEFEKHIVSEAESLLKSKSADSALPLLKTLGLDAWGELLWSMPNDKYPNLAALLPKMSSEAIQNAWTGTHGKTLLNQTIPFVRYLLSVSNYHANQNNGLKVLDYGCGYGRISRLMLKYVSTEDLFGADPWQESIDLVHESGFGENFKLTDEVPPNLPYGINSFDLIWAFSVFTHLSPEVAKISLETLSRYLAKKGSLVITLRPIEYWEMRNDLSTKIVKELRASHKKTGTSFLPHNREVVGSYGITYGDTTISLETLEKMIPNLAIRDIERSEIDPYQIYVLLQHK
jgi:SAM-dependent methyltransferase